jgi:hypothetical protein
MAQSREEKLRKKREWAKRWRLANPEAHRQENRVWAAKKRRENPEPHRAAQRKHRKAHQEKRQAATREWAAKRPGIYLFYNARQRAKKLGLPFNIEPSDIVIPAVCPVLGIPIEATVRGRRGFHPNSPSLDRIVPELGYVKGNVCVISMRANWIKRDATAEELFLIAEYVARATRLSSAA